MKFYRSLVCDFLRDFYFDSSIKNYLQIEIPHPIMAEKVSGGVKSVSRIVLDTNVYGIRLPQIPVYRYDIRIVAKTSGGKELELTKQCRDELVYNINNEVFKMLRDVWRRM